MPSPGSSKAWIAAAYAPLAPTVTQISVAGSARRPLSRWSFCAIAWRSSAAPSANEYVLRFSRMAAIAPSRTRGGVGRSQMPWPRLIPPTRSHSRVMRRISDWSSPCRRFAMRMRAGRLLRPQGILQRRTRGEIAQRLDQDIEAALQVGDLDLLVHVVAGIRLSREPHAE